MGTSTKCLNEHISRADMDALTNNQINNYNQVLYSDGCHPNEFSLDAISEHYIKNPNGGGVAFIGNSDAGYWGNVSFFVDHFCKDLYDLSKQDAYNNQYYYIGNLNYNSAKDEIKRLKNRNLLGDPEMMVWTSTPTNLTVSNLNYSIANKQITGTISGLTYNLTPIVRVTVCAWKGSEIYSVKDNIDATTASVNFTLDNIVADTPGDITITVTAHNYIPNVSTINVSSITGAHPHMTSFIINDNNATTGNNDGLADAGETIALPVVITNSGNTTATNVTATLSWTASVDQIQSGSDATITIGASSCNFGTILSGQTSNNNSAPYVFTINKNAFENISLRPLTQYAKFTLNIYVNGTLFSAKTLDIQFDESNLKKGENITTGTLAASSTNQLSVKLYNMGLGKAIGTADLLNATLTTNNPSNITIVNGTAQYNNINGVNTQPNYNINNSTFSFTVGSQNFSNETFNLSITDKYGKTWSFNNFSLTKPQNNITSISHNGYKTSILLNWVVSTNPLIQGYNLYRSTSSNGTYLKVNNNIINYTTYLDEGLQQLTTYYYKLTAVDDSGNESIYYPANGYAASTSLDFHTGWPVTATVVQTDLTITGRAEGSPNVFDLFGDGNKEIFFTTGYEDKGGVWAFRNDASRWYSFDGNPTNKNGYINLQCKTLSTPAISDINNDGIVELAVPTSSYAVANNQKLFVYNLPTGEGAPPVIHPSNYPVSIGGWMSVKGSVYSDIDNDGNMESILNNVSDGNDGQNPPNETRDGGIKVFNSNGTIHTGWSGTSTLGYNCGFSMPVAFDFDNDNHKEIVIGCESSAFKSAGIYIFKENGTNFGTGNPVYSPPAGFKCDFPPIVADLNNNGTNVILFISASGTTANIYAIKSDGTAVSGWGWTENHPSFVLSNSVGTTTDCSQSCPSFSVGDINKDGYPEVVCGDNGHLYIWSHLGGNVPLKDIVIEGYTSRNEKAPIIADVDDNYNDLEVIVTNTTTNPDLKTNIYAYKINGANAGGFPITINGKQVQNTPCVDDIDNDGLNELIVTTPSDFYVWDSFGNAINNVYGWGSYRRDNLNSGVYYVACSFSSVPLEITTSQSWNSFKKINSNILIKQGNTLTIESLGNIIMTSQAKIIIEQGGKLIIDGGKISSACGGMWKGIEVWGTENKSQFTADLQYQGQVEIKNGGVIENAEVGVYVGKRDNTGYGLSGFGGGIVKATSAVFRNNKVAVDFQLYFGFLISNPAVQKPNFSYFTYCTFETNSSWNFANTNPDAFVKLNAVDGIAFSGCTFQNTTPANFSVYNRGKGIVTEDGYFILKQYCASPTNPCTNLISNTFTNLYYAIDAQKIYFDNSLIIKNAVFNSNYRGVYVSAMLTPTITDNTFSIPDYDPNITMVLPTDNQPYGLYLNASTGYTVENNAFNNATANRSTKYGAIINGSGTANNRIYRNTFTNLYLGSSAQGINRGSGTGLVFKCNEYTNCSRDISMSPYNRFYGAAALYQGSTTDPAANLFSHSGSTRTSDIYNESWVVNYYHSTSATPIPRWVPVNYSTSIGLYNTNIPYNKTTQCPVTISGGGGGSTAKDVNSSYVAIQNMTTEITTIENQLSNLVDGGNTAVLLNNVENSPSWEALYLRNNLLSKSPFLSDTVLISTVKNESAMPPLMLTDVLKANPQAIKSESIKESINNRQNAVPDYLMYQIENSGKFISAKEHLEAKALMLRNRRASDVYSLITEYKADTLNKYAVDSICGLLNFETTCNTLFNKYMLMLQANRIQTANEYLNQIGDADLIFLATLASDLKLNLKRVDSLSVSDINQLSQIANNEGSCGNFIARNLLLKLHKINYTEPIYDESQNDSKKMMVVKPQKETQDDLMFRIYPNPAKNWVIVYYKTKSIPFTIEVCDLLGKVIYSKAIEQAEGELMIETYSFSSGNYFVKLQAQGVILKTEKLTISTK